MKFSKSYYTPFFAIVLFFVIGCQSCQTPKTFVVEPIVMKENRVRIQQGDVILENALKQMIRQADSVMETPIRSVMDKPVVPPSGDKHDYLSRGTYWWPDPAKPDGIPYIQKDGKINPEVNTIRDFHYMTELNSAIKILGVAYYYTNDDRYVMDAVKRLRTWFLDSSTRMNPALNHSQAIPGVSDGRMEGIIDTRTFVDLIDGVQLMATSKVFPQPDLDGLKGWFSDFLGWMTTSKIGKNGGTQTNNIGTAYYMQLITYALFTNNRAVAEKALRGPVPKLIDVQFEQDGSQPKELSRTNAWSYSTSNLNYWFRIARLAEHVNIDIWNYVSPSGKSIRAGYEWLLPYANNDQKWAYQQIRKTDFNQSFSSIRRRAVRKYNHTSREGSRGGVVAQTGERKERAARDNSATRSTVDKEVSVSLSPMRALTEGY